MFTLRRLVPILALGALAGPAVSSAAAETAEPLGRCTAPKPPHAELERLSVSNPVKVAANGTPSGRVGVTVRNRTGTYEGSLVDLYVTVTDVGTGKVVGQINRITSGCVRLTWALTESSAPAISLKKGRLYMVKASAGFTDWGGSDPLGGLTNFAYEPITFFSTN